MNTKPDETTLARWLDDDLVDAELAAFDASHPADATLLARRQELREWRATCAAAIPAEIEPAYPEFFNHRVVKAIGELKPKPLPLRCTAAFWRAWWMPATAAAGMVLAFWLGTKTGGVPQVVMFANPDTVTVAVQQPTVYTPEHGVDAEWFSSSDAAATVIVLEGVDAIPDTLDFSESIGFQATVKATAALEPPDDAEVPE